MYHTSHTERLKEQSSRHSDARREPHQHRQHEAFHHSHSSMGAVGHWVRTAGLLAPLVIGELIKDPDKRWRWVRLASVATTLVSEGLYANKVRHERAHTRELESELSC
jgi:hypothetical protein